MQNKKQSLVFFGTPEFFRRRLGVPKSRRSETGSDRDPAGQASGKTP